MRRLSIFLYCFGNWNDNSNLAGLPFFQFFSIVSISSIAITAWNIESPFNFSLLFRHINRMERVQAPDIFQFFSIVSLETQKEVFTPSTLSIFLYCFMIERVIHTTTARFNFQFFSIVSQASNVVVELLFIEPFNFSLLFLMDMMTMLPSMMTDTFNFSLLFLERLRRHC